MELSAVGLDLIKRCEGFRSDTYLDVAGLPTIGYGHRLTEGEQFPAGITEAQAEVILKWDTNEAASAVTRLVKVPLTQGQFDALVDFTFNLGSARLRNSTLLTYLNAGRYSDASLELLRWNHAGQKVVEGLTKRRQAEFNLWHGRAAA